MSTDRMAGTYGIWVVVAITCSLFFPVAAFGETREQLETELKQVEAEISRYEQDLSQTKTQKQTLTNKINALKKEQAKIALQIKKTGIQIAELGKDISLTEGSIQTTVEKLKTSRAQPAHILQTLYERDQKSVVEILLAEQNISAFFRELVSIRLFSEKLVVVIGQMKVAKTELEGQRSNLQSQQGDQQSLLAVQTLQRQGLQTKTGEQNQLLKVTQGKEAQYQAMLANSQKRAGEIRNRIYELLGGSTRITFGEAAKIAQQVSKQTGVRAEFLLAILTQESNLGKNIGTCNRAGDPPSKSWKVVMKPDRDQTPFIAITQELGRNPDITPVSCPLKDSRGNQIGWGGAMGPAQFIPSTWELYKDTISAITGSNPANPWNTRDAFVAAALLLKDNGAAQGGANAEWKAAMLYFSGSTNPRFRFYGDNVVALANSYSADLKAIS